MAESFDLVTPAPEETGAESTDPIAALMSDPDALESIGAARQAVTMGAPPPPGMAPGMPPQGMSLPGIPSLAPAPDAPGQAGAYGQAPQVDIESLIQALTGMFQSQGGGPQERPEPERAPLSLTWEQKQRLAKQIRHYYDEAMRGATEREDLRAYRYRRYIADPSLRNGLQPWPDAPRLFLPMTRSTIEALKTNLGAELFESMDKIACDAIGKTDEEAAKRARKFFRWWLEDIVNIRLLNSDLMIDAMIDALSVVKVYPHKNVYPALHEDAVFFDVETKMEAVDQGALLIPPDATGLSFPEARYLGHRLWEHPDTLREMEERGFEIPKMEALTLQSAVNERDWTEDERRWLEYERMGIDPTPDYPEPEIEIVEFYCLFALEENKQREFVVVHWMPNVRGMRGAEGEHGLIMRVVRLEDAIPQAGFSKPTWPFFPIRLWPQPRQLYGMDVPTRLESMQDILNRQAEQMLHDGDISVLPFYFYNAALTGELPDLTQIKPGAGVPIDNSGQVYFPPRQSNNRHYAEQMQFANLWAEKDSGVTSFTQGRSPDQPNAPRTLGGQQLLMDQSNRSFNEQTQLLADQWRPALTMAFSVWQSRLPPSVKIPMPDLDGIEERLLDGSQAPLVMQEIKHSDLSGLFDIRVRVDPEAFLKQQRQLQLAQALDQILAPIWPLGRRELWKQLWELMKLKEFDKLWPESVAVMQTQILIMQAQIQLVTLEGQLMQMQQAQALAEVQALLQASGVGTEENGTQPAAQGQAGGQPPSGPPQVPQAIQATGNMQPQNMGAL